MEWIKIYTTQDRIKGEIVKSALNEQGIPNVVMNKQDSAYVLLGDIEIMVPKEDVDEAYNLINSLTYEEGDLV